MSETPEYTAKLRADSVRVTRVTADEITVSLWDGAEEIATWLPRSLDVGDSLQLGPMAIAVDVTVAGSRRV